MNAFQVFHSLPAFRLFVQSFIKGNLVTGYWIVYSRYSGLLKVKFVARSLPWSRFLILRLLAPKVGQQNWFSNGDSTIQNSTYPERYREACVTVREVLQAC